MQCYTELIAPSAVTHALSLPFLDSNTKNLIIAKTSLLQIFSIKQATTEARNDNAYSNSSTKSRLVLVGEYPLSGTITSMASIRSLNTKSGGDALLIALKDAKLSLVEWDPENYRINTVSIHYYEGDNVIGEPFGPSLSECPSILTVDPSSRCAALKFGARHLAILPFRQLGDELGDVGEDGYDPDIDAAPPSANLRRTQSGLNDAAEQDVKQTPYEASFVLPLTALDPSLTHPIDLQFLHEYREPTFGILSASTQPSVALVEERKDVITYSVFTLDLDQRASTSLVSLQKLPSDLHRVLPLPLPIGGALLSGYNEFVHVDQSGRPTAVAVNESATAITGFNMSNQSDLQMKLENCEIEALDPKVGDLLIILDDASLAVLSFKLSGRNVGGLTVTRVAAHSGGNLLEAAPSCVASLNDHAVFIGSEDGDSRLIDWERDVSGGSPLLSRKRSHAQMLGHDGVADDEEAEDMDEDDLYATESDANQRRTSFFGPIPADAASSYKFELVDTLPLLGSINDTCFGRTSSMQNDKLELVAATGRGKASRLSFMNKSILPAVTGSTTFDNAKDAWSFPARTADDQQEDDFDNLLFVFDGDSTRVYDVADTSDGTDTTYTERTGTEFEHEGETLSLSLLANGTRVVQCRRNEIRSYDATDLALSQIIPMIDEETDAELKIVHSSFCDPYLLILRDDSTVELLKVDNSGDIEPLESEAALSERKWLSGCLYAGELFDGDTIACLLGEEGGLHLMSLPTCEALYNIPTLSYLPAVLSPEVQQRRVGTKETLTEVLLADIGRDDVKQPYLVLRSAMDDLILYEPWTYGTGSLSETLRFRKIPLTYVPKFDEYVSEESDGRPEALKWLTVNGYTMIHVPGPESHFIIKEPSSQPSVIAIQSKDVKALVSLHRKDCEHGFGLIDATGELQTCHLPADTNLSTGWSVTKSALGSPTEDVRLVDFHERRQVYVVATCKEVDFYYPEDDGKRQDYDDDFLRPQVPQYTLHLLSATTRNVVHSFEMPYSETITSMKVMPLEVSEHTHEQKTVVVVGTVVQRGEDMPTKGAIHVFEILDVVPDPDRPDSGCKLHAISREETKGGITAVESFPNGMIGTGQGQKLMVRGLKEDGSCLPVAFLDGQCYTTQLKTFAQSGMWLAADAEKGLWFGGFTEEPYKINVLAKGRPRMEIVSADFLPFEGFLYLILIDAQTDLHILQYDPEDPKTLSGLRLLHRSKFHLGHFPSSMTLIPSTLAPTSQQPLTNGYSEDEEPMSKLFQVLTTSYSGSIGLVTPVDEPTYRRLGAMQAHLTSVLEHAVGLNPRVYRGVEGDGFGARGVIDGSLVQRINELGSTRRAEVLGRAGADIWALRSDLEIIGGGGLAYL